jgi:PadR family transcriptional regulator, regulatory protein PadR
MAPEARIMPDDPEQDVERWEAQLRKGTLELAILASLSGARLYGLEILRVLEARSKLGLAEGTLYLILSRLRKDGLVESEWVDAGSGHPRKYYWLTQKGTDRLRRMAQSWVQFSAGLDAAIAPVLKRRGDRDVR